MKIKLKTIIIILVILGILFLGWIFFSGDGLSRGERQCKNAVCIKYSTYIYDDLEKLCSCYEDNELIYKKYIVLEE